LAFGILFLFIALSTLNKILTIHYISPLNSTTICYFKRTLKVLLKVLNGFPISLFLLIFLIQCLQHHLFMSTSNCLFLHLPICWHTYKHIIHIMIYPTFYLTLTYLYSQAKYCNTFTIPKCS